MPAWLRQMGIKPRSPLTAMRECVTAVRALLEGEELTTEGRCFSFDRVRLTYTPDTPVPLYMGVLAPKMMRMSGEIADGNVLSVLSTPAYLRWARERAAEGAREAGRSEPRALSTFAFFSVDRDGGRAKRGVRESDRVLPGGGRPQRADRRVRHQRRARGDARVGRSGRRRARDARPVARGSRVAGEPDECAEKIRRLLDAGADSVALFPMPSEHSEEMVRAGAADVLPRLT